VPTSPSANRGANVFDEQNPKVSKLFPAYEVNGGELNLSGIWNLDFWGKHRRQTEVARARLLASQQENLLSVLLGENPQAVSRGRALTEHHDELDLQRMEDFSGQQIHGGGRC
jgi:hypothetical protein